MTISKSTIKKLKENYENLGLLEAIDAFHQITGLVIEEAPKYPCQAKEALLELHKKLFALIQEHFGEEDLREDTFKKLIDIIEEDIYRVIYNADIILAAIYKVKSSLFPQDTQVFLSK